MQDVKEKNNPSNRINVCYNQWDTRSRGTVLHYFFFTCPGYFFYSVLHFFSLWSFMLGTPIYMILLHYKRDMSKAFSYIGTYILLYIWPEKKVFIINKINIPIHGFCRLGSRYKELFGISYLNVGMESRNLQLESYIYIIIMYSMLHCCNIKI